MNQEEFLAKVKSVHGDLFDCSHVEYKNAHTHFILTCPKHGLFKTTYQSLVIKKRHCPKCGDEKGRKNRNPNQLGLTNEDVIKLAQEKHGDEYGYSKLEYVGTKRLMTITCKKHGDFKQSFALHVRKGCGCPKCYPPFVTLNKIDTSKIKNFKTRQGKKVLSECKKHGEYSTWISNSVYKNTGCPRCCTKESRGQKELTKFLSKFVEVEINKNIFIGSSKTVDVFIPSLNVAIEYNGVYFHSTGAKNYQKIPVTEREAVVRKEELWKFKECKKLGIRFITILDTEWLEQTGRVKSFLMGVISSSLQIGARETSVKILIKAEAFSFLDKHHMQGSPAGNKEAWYYGLFYKDKLVSVMTFSGSSYRRKLGDNGVDLSRYASIARVAGGASKLFKRFLFDNPFCKEVLSFCDPRLFTGDLYEKLGFKLEVKYPYDYKFLKGKQLFHKAHFTKQRLKKIGIPDACFKTMEEANIFKVFLPGQLRYRFSVANS